LLKIVKKAFTGLKTHKYHIFFSRILLICFIAGQLMVYAHQHPVSAGEGKVSESAKTSPHQILKEKCYLCDVMHHNAMDITTQMFSSPITVAVHVFKSNEYSFTSIQLILSSGRAPPLLNFLV